MRFLLEMKLLEVVPFCLEYSGRTTVSNAATWSSWGQGFWQDCRTQHHDPWSASPLGRPG